MNAENALLNSYLGHAAIDNLLDHLGYEIVDSDQVRRTERHAPLPQLERLQDRKAERC